MNPGEDHAEAARQAVAAGRVALGQGDNQAARRWFGRARRLAPSDTVALHMLLSAVAPDDPRGALGLSAELLRAAPRDREARILRVALLHRCGLHADAADALDALLRQFAAPRNAAFTTLARQVARQGRQAGWVGVTGAGIVVCHAPDVVLSLDKAGAFAVGLGEHALPQAWVDARCLHAASPAGRVLGGTIDLAALRHVEGFAEYDPVHGLHGWALRPADPDAVPVLEIYAGAGRAPLLTVLADDGGRRHRNPMPHGRSFEVAAALLPRTGVLHVRARHGPALAGSPIAIGQETRSVRRAVRAGTDPWRPLPAVLASQHGGKARRQQARPIDVIVVVDRKGGCADCVASVRNCLTPGARVVVVDDAWLDAAETAWARRAARAGELVLLRHKTRRGYAAAVSTGLRHAGSRDVVVLRSAARLPPDALARLAEVAYAAPSIGTVTPMETGGGITGLGIPAPGGADADANALAEIDAALRRANHACRVDIPVCGSICTYIKAACLRDSGALRDHLFTYGVDAWHDFARRAAVLGWRNTVACDIAVASAASETEAEQNKSILERFHPRHGASLAAFAKQDTLHPARQAYQAQLWTKARLKAAIVLVTHAFGGGVERHLADRIGSIRGAGMRAIVVRPRNGYAVSDGAADTHPDLIFATVEKLAAFLRADHPGAVELHHIAAHAPGIERLAGLLRVPFDIAVHDYSSICPRVTLSIGSGAYCGEPPDARDCDDCIADHGARMPFSGRVADLRAAQASLFAVARAVIAPSHDAARRLRRYMPRVQPLVRPWQDDTQAVRPIMTWRGGELHVAVCGAIGPHKGYDVLLACARDAARRALPLRFTVVGHTVDDARLLATGRVFVTGPYAEGEEVELLRETAADIGFIPSVWPETWCYALSHLWHARLHVVAFDLGAQAERITAHGGGTLVPLGVGAGMLNDTLLGVSAGGNVPFPPDPPSRLKKRGSGDLSPAGSRGGALGLCLLLSLLPGLAYAHFSIADYAPAGTVLDATGHADASAALANAIRAANAITAKGEPACVYVPPGVYRIVTPPPAFVRAGCIKGDGSTQSTLSIDKDFSGDLFAWSEAWWPTTPGPVVVGLKIRGTPGAVKPQNAMVFYDRNDQVFIDDVEVDQLHGRALYSGVKLHTSQAYMRESHMRSLRFFMDGAPGVPVVEFSSEGEGQTDATNEIALSQVDIFGPSGPGFVIRNNGSGGVRDFMIEALRIEGWQAGTSPGDLLTIGDARMRGNVNNIRLTDVELIDPQAGYAALRLTAAPGAEAPYQITYSGLIGGGAPRGEGLRIDAGRTSVFRFSGIHTFGTQVVIGRGVSEVTIDGGGQESAWRFTVDPTSVFGVSVPIFQAGGWRR